MLQARKSEQAAVYQTSRQRKRLQSYRRLRYRLVKNCPPNRFRR